jgi:hypothetical protein
MSTQTADSDDLLAELGRKYIWWAPVGSEPHARERVIAQVMDLGTYEDIQRLEAALGFEQLADIMLHAAPGWFSPRSWGFWRGRLARETNKAIPSQPPRRSFHAAMF